MDFEAIDKDIDRMLGVPGLKEARATYARLARPREDGYIPIVQQYPQHLFTVVQQYHGMGFLAYLLSTSSKFNERTFEEQHAIVMKHVSDVMAGKYPQYPFHFPCEEELMDAECVAGMRATVTAALKAALEKATTASSLEKIMKLDTAGGTLSQTSFTSPAFTGYMSQFEYPIVSGTHLGEYLAGLESMVSYELERVHAAAREMAGRGLPPESIARCCVQLSGLGIV